MYSSHPSSGHDHHHHHHHQVTMDHAQQQWMWMKRHRISSHSAAATWEERAFAEDASGVLIWPPRSYSCSFCRREFRSAQALGGHMNVHRRDRARLKQQQDQEQDDEDDDHHPITTTTTTTTNSSVRVSSSSTTTTTAEEHCSSSDKITMVSKSSPPPRTRGNDHCWLDLGLTVNIVESGDDYYNDVEGAILVGGKRRKTAAGTTAGGSIAVPAVTLSLSREGMRELDLELRLSRQEDN